MFKSLNFQEGKSWKYDSYHVIYIWFAIRSSWYVHEIKFESERLYNKENWREVQENFQGKHDQLEKQPKVKKESIYTSQKQMEEVLEVFMLDYD